MSPRRRSLAATVLCLAAALVTPTVIAAVQGVRLTDVATRAFAVVWASDEAVTDARVRVFQDPEGATEITGSVGPALVSSAVPGAAGLGLVKVDVTGLEPDTTYYLFTETQGAGGLVVYPADGTLMAVRTSVGNALAGADGTPIANDLILQEVADPADGTAVPGALVLLRVPAVSSHPLTALAGTQDGAPVPAAVDLNNLFADLPPAGDGRNGAAPPGAVLDITEYRGLRCADPTTQALTFRRRLPPAGAAPLLTSARTPVACYAPSGVAADFDCDGTVGGADFGLFLARYGSLRSADPCRFHPDYDLNADGRVDPSDFNDLLIVFGSSE